jgi:hypothetical protein
MLRKFFLPILIVFGVLGTAWADNSVGIPDVHIGDMWKYKIVDGYSNETTGEISHRIVKLDDKQIVYQVRNLLNKNASKQNLAYATREWNVFDNGSQTWDPFFPEYKFPLSVGKTWSQEYRGSNNEGKTSSALLKAKVIALEKVTVSAGKFDAYRIELDLESRNTGEDANIYRNHIIIWYAPIVKKYVRRENTTFSNGRERSKRIEELFEYSLREDLPATSK